MQTDGHIGAVLWNGIFPGLILVSYVINIGYSRGWKKWPDIISAAVFLGIGTFGYFATGIPTKEHYCPS